MKKILLVMFLSLLFTFSVHAQNTNVTATITDAGGQTWNNGTYTFNFIPKPQFNGTYRLSGAPYTPVAISGSLSSVGAFTSVPVPDNNLITPIGTQWTVTVCAQTQFICFTSGFLTITGASQTITSSVIPPAISTTCGPGAVAYADSEVNCSIGGQYYNLTNLGNRQCTAVTGNVCTTWISVGGGISAFNVKNYGAIGDAKKTKTAVASNGSSTITDPTASPWLATDIGKKIFCVLPPSSNIATGGPIATITGFTSASQISIAPATSFGNSAVNCVWFTQKETTAFLAAQAAATPTLASRDPNANSPTLGQPGNVSCPPGGYVVDAAFINIQGSSSNSLGPNFVGSGNNSCIIYISPDANPNGLVGGFISEYQVYKPKLSGFLVDCSGFLFNFAKPLVEFNNVTLASWNDIVITGCNNSGDNTGIFNVTGSGLVFTSSTIVAANQPGNTEPAFFCNNTNTIFIENALLSNSLTQNEVWNNCGARDSFSGPISVKNTLSDECGASPCIRMVNSVVAFDTVSMFAGLRVDGTSRAYLNAINVGEFSLNGANTVAIQEFAGSYVYATGSHIRGNGTSAAVDGPSTATFIDAGGNNFQNCTAVSCTDITVANVATLGFTGGIVPTFNLVPNALTQLGGRQIVRGLAPTFAVTGFGTGPTVTIGTGSSDAAGSVLITAGTAPGSSGTFTLTFSTATGAYGTNPPACIFGLLNGTGSWNALAQEPVIQTPTTTSVVGNWADNSVPLTAASTYGFVWSCYGK